MPRPRLGLRLRLCRLFRKPYRTVPLRIRLTIASKMIAPISE
jgi:hypothetical protein